MTIDPPIPQTRLIFCAHCGTHLRTCPPPLPSQLSRICRDEKTFVQLSSQFPAKPQLPFDKPNP